MQLGNRHEWILTNEPINDYGLSKSLIANELAINYAATMKM